MRFFLLIGILGEIIIASVCRLARYTFLYTLILPATYTLQPFENDVALIQMVAEQSWFRRLLDLVRRVYSLRALLVIVGVRPPAPA